MLNNYWYITSIIKFSKLCCRDFSFINCSRNRFFFFRFLFFRN